MGSYWVTCYTCDGRGLIRHTETCSDCKGEGCSSCRGSGTEVSEYSCPNNRCGGNGGWWQYTKS